MAKRIIASAFFHSGLVSKKLKRLSKDHSLTLMYHRILPSEETLKGVQAGMFVEPDTLEMHIRFLKKRFTVAPLSAFLKPGRSKSGELNSRPVCFLTFDDGWGDFYKYAFPIFVKHQVPATVFLPTDFIGTNSLFWTDRLAQLLLNWEVVREANTGLSPPKKNLVVNTLQMLRGRKEIWLDSAIELLKGYTKDEVERALAELSECWNIDQQFEGRVFLSWAEVKEMRQSGLISYGSHTAKHIILTQTNEQEIRDELERSKRELVERRVVTPSFLPFCYPNGNHSERVARMVKKAGYQLAVTTIRGWNRSIVDRFKLRRIGVHQDVAFNMAMYGCRVAGLL